MLAATVLGSGIAALDATVVNIALPAIGRDFDAGLDDLQWVVNGYTLTLAGCCCSAARSATATAGGGCSSSASSGSPLASAAVRRRPRRADP